MVLMKLINKVVSLNTFLNDFNVAAMRTSGEGEIVELFNVGHRK